MSFLGNIVGSIGDGKAPPPPPPPPPQLPNKPADANLVRANSVTTKPTSRSSTPIQSSGIKRKAEDNAGSASQRSTKPASNADANSAIRRPAAPPLNAPRHTDKAPVPRIQTDKVAKPAPSRPSPTTGTSSPKPAPTKGSFAELMARAKAQDPKQKIGVITHTKSAPKEKLSKRAEQKKAEGDKLRKEKSGNGGVRKPDSRRSASPAKKGVQEGRVSKAPAKPSYKGTMGISTGRDQPRKESKRRYDEYLGTDEEDNSDIVEDDDDEGGYESSDMEGGFDELEMEEQTATRQAKADDARELAIENQLKREKEERRRRLMNLANKRR